MNLQVLGRRCFAVPGQFGCLYLTSTRQLHTNNKWKRKKDALRVARHRMKDDIRESPLEPTPLPSIDATTKRLTVTHLQDSNLNLPADFVPQEIIHANNLRQAYRSPNSVAISHYGNVYSDQRDGEKWFNDKMNKLNEYQESKRRWIRFLRACSLSRRVINQVLPKLPNNQAPLTTFWVKQTIDWLSDNRDRYLIKFGATHKQVEKLFREYDNNHFYREWPRDMEIEQIVTMLQAHNDKRSNQEWKNIIASKRNENTKNGTKISNHQSRFQLSGKLQSRNQLHLTN